MFEAASQEREKKLTEFTRTNVLVQLTGCCVCMDGGGGD